ncbi:hypothetical protein CAPTEDRAFT_228184, partial [Capitella teleta]
MHKGCSALTATYWGLTWFLLSVDYVITVIPKSVGLTYHSRLFKEASQWNLNIMTSFVTADFVSLCTAIGTLKRINVMLQWSLLSFSHTFTKVSESAQQEVAANPEQLAAEPAETEAAAETQETAADVTPVSEEESGEKAEDEAEKPADALSTEAKEEDVTEEAKAEEEEKDEGEIEEGGGEPKEETEAAEGEAEDGKAEEATPEEQAEGTPVEGGEAPEGAADAVEGEAPPEGAAEHGDLDEIKEEGEEAAEASPEAPLESEGFAEGERPDSPVVVGEKLSREATPAAIEADPARGITQSPPVPGTPPGELVEPQGLAEEGEEEEEEEEEEDEEEDEEEQQPDFDRDQLIESYNQALQERQQLQEQNYQLQHRLAEYFRKKKSDENRQEVDKNVTDQEQRYLKYMANLDELQRQEGEERDIYREQIEELNRRCNEKQELVDNERQ